jgi:hypothetical protein
MGTHRGEGQAGLLAALVRSRFEGEMVDGEG